MNFWSFLTRQAMNMAKRSAVACVRAPPPPPPTPAKRGVQYTGYNQSLGDFISTIGKQRWNKRSCCALNKPELMKFKCNQMIHPYKFYTFYRDQSHWIVEAWVVFLHFFLVPLCWSAVSERQMLLTFCGRFIWSGQTSLNFKWFLWLLPWLYHWIIYSFYYSPMSMLLKKKKTTKYCLKHEGKSDPCHPWQN